MVPVFNGTENSEALLYINAYRTSNGSTLTYLGACSNSRYAPRSAEIETLAGRVRRHPDLAYDGWLQNAQKHNAETNHNGSHNNNGNNPQQPNKRNNCC